MELTIFVFFNYSVPGSEGLDLLSVLMYPVFILCGIAMTFFQTRKSSINGWELRFNGQGLSLVQEINPEPKTSTQR